LFGSGFVPTDSMPVGLRWFAELQPFTPIMEALRGLLLGTPVGTATASLAVGWCAVIALVGYAWAKWLYNRDRTR
jgi:ABC-2 type transport system permease protein